MTVCTTYIYSHLTSKGFSMVIETNQWHSCMPMVHLKCTMANHETFQMYHSQECYWLTFQFTACLYGSFYLWYCIGKLVRFDCGIILWYIAVQKMIPKPIIKVCIFYYKCNALIIKTHNQSQQPSLYIQWAYKIAYFLSCSILSWALGVPLMPMV